MDFVTFQGFNFDFNDPKTQSNSVEFTSPSQRHVHWANLPRPDHMTGQISYTSPYEIDSADPDHSAYGRTALRQSILADALNPSHAYKNSRARRKSCVNSTPTFRDVQWIDPPHPGTRIPVDVYEHETVSPRSSVFVHPHWDVEMNAEVFRARVQPSKATGRRRPGMNAARGVRSARSGKNDELGESCLVM